MASPYDIFVGSPLPSAGGVAEAFQAGQTTVSNVLTNAQRQRQLEQAMQFAEAEQPYRMAGLQRADVAGNIELENLQRKQAAMKEYQAGLNAPLPAYARGLPTGAGYMPVAPAPAGVVEPTTGAPVGLAQSESGGRTNIVNQYGYGGRLQFGQDRLNDAIAAGVAPQGTTVQAFAQNPQLQQQVEAWHFNDINNYIQSQGLGKYVGQTVGGAVVTPQGMLAAAHLGGKAGLKQFLESGGKYDPADPLGTTLSSYMSRFGGVATPSPVPTFAQGGAGLAVSTGGVPMAPAGNMSGFTRDLIIGGLAETVGGYPATTTGQYFAAPFSRGLNYFFGTPETSANLAQRDATAIAAKNWYGSAPVKEALYSRPELLQEAQQNPAAFYQKYKDALGAPTAAPGLTGQPAPTAPTTAPTTAPGLTGQPAPVAPTAAPTATGVQEPTTPMIAAIQAAKPGAPVPAPNATTYLRNAPKINSDMQVIVAQDRELERIQKYYAQSGDIEKAAEQGLKRIQLRSTYQNLQGLQSITNFDLGDNISISDAMSRSTGRKIGIQPLSNGNFNLMVDGQVTRSNVSRADIKDAAQYMLSDSYRTQTMDMQKKQMDLQIELIKERAKAGYKIQEKQLDKLYEGVTKLQVERLKLSGFKVVEGEEGKFFVYKQDGSYAAYVDPEGKVRMPDGTEVSNTSVSQIPLIVPMTPTGR